MRLFGENKSKVEIKNTEQKGDDIKVTERPRICCVDLSDDTIEALKKSGANVHSGTLGSKIKIPNSHRREQHQVLPNFEFPSNLHEFDIIIIDLNNFKTIEYKPEDHVREVHTGKTSVSFLSCYPETLFDPRPMGSYILGTQLSKITNREFLVIAFTCSSYEIDYETVEINEGYAERKGTQRLNIYSFWDYVPTSVQKFGKELTVQNVHADFQSLLEKYKSGVDYNQTFHHPTRWTNNGSEHDERYFPLFTNLNGDIVSYLESSDHNNLILLPQIKDKRNFLLEFFSRIGPSFYPTLFPFSTTFNWKTEEKYWLPKHAQLLQEKENIEKEFQRRISESEAKIQNNLAKYSFLHEIISETGDNLTNALIKYLKWLGFEDVEHYDGINKTAKVLEEDIQVKLNKGLLIIECKGIGGTSTDSDCSQISKIKHRRSKERGAFDVYALYIVNHQRYLPPLKRQNPPFTEHQIQDAINDERGLMTTWQLFNLYFDIEKGVITKEEARKLLLNYGLIEFKPADLVYVYKPTEIFNEGKVCIVTIDGIELSIGDELFIEKNGKFEKAELLGIQENGSSLQTSSKGELGLKLSKKVTKKSILWKKGSR
jgi:hypothetical protein